MKPHLESKQYSSVWIRDIFDRIAGRYDFFNDLFSLGIHRSWKLKAIRMLGDLPGKVILDAATGTGDVAIRLAKRGARVIGVDFSSKMLEIAREKSLDVPAVTYFLEDAQTLSFQSNYFDGAVITFGIRNFEYPKMGIRELWRVLKPGGTLVILEFGNWSDIPVLRSFVNATVRLYAKDREAYAHLVQSSTVFPGGNLFLDRYIRPLPELSTYRSRPLFFGLAFLYSAKKVETAVGTTDQGAICAQRTDH